MQKEAIYEFLIKALPEAGLYESGAYLAFSENVMSMCEIFAMYNKRCGNLITCIIAEDSFHEQCDGYVCDFKPIVNIAGRCIGYEYSTCRFAKVTEQKLNEIVDHIRILIQALHLYTERRATYKLIKEIDNL